MHNLTHAAAGRPGREEQVNGGTRLEYPFEALPEATRAHIDAQAVAASPAPPQPEGGLATLCHWQQDRLEARLALLSQVDRLRDERQCSDRRAMQVFLARGRAGALPAEVQEQIARTGAFSRPTLMRWRAERKQGLARLAPRRRVQHTPAWAEPLLRLFQRPTKPALSDALRAMAATGQEVPSYDQAKRYLRSLGSVERMRGRMLGNELRSMRPFVRRDTSGLRPGDVYTADGHTFHAEVAHPLHGRPFRPELTLILDAATRRPVGWACSIAENALSVLDALRHAVLRCGVPAVFYADRGPGYRNEMLEGPGIGFANRLGITIEHSRPQNPQAHGLVERAHQSLWVRAARGLPTYMGADMDRQARQRVFKDTRSAKPRALPSWAEFCRLTDAAVAEYERRPHRALPRVVDPITNAHRHQTPLQAWNAACAQRRAPEVPSAEVADSLFRPQVWRTTQRGEVELFGNTYFSLHLEEHHGRRVAIGYDVWDAHRVWVRDEEQRLLCVAEWDANRRSYFPKSAIDYAREQRERGRLARLERRVDEVRAEAASEIDAPVPEAIPLTDEERRLAERIQAELRAKEEAAQEQRVINGKPVFTGEFAERDWGRWCLEHWNELDTEYQGFFTRRLESSVFAELVGVERSHIEQLKQTTG